MAAGSNSGIYAAHADVALGSRDATTLLSVSVSGSVWSVSYLQNQELLLS